MGLGTAVLLGLLFVACGGDDDGDGVLSITAAAEASPGDLATVQGFIVADTSGVRLCEVLAESFPPQCGGSFFNLTEFDAAAFPQIFTKGPDGEVVWTDQPQEVIGLLESGGIIRVQGLGGIE